MLIFRSIQVDRFLPFIYHKNMTNENILINLRLMLNMKMLDIK